MAGYFYPASPEALRREVERCFLHPLGPGSVPRVGEVPLPGPVGLVVPHAGYRYSGPVAARGLSALAPLGRPGAFVILGPNHYGAGPGLALSPASAWETPLGTVPLDRGLAEGLLQAVPGLAYSEPAHRQEHSVEVQVPLLQFLYGAGITILPLVMEDQSLATALRLGEALAGLVRGRGVALLASTDLSHYYPQSQALRRDRLVVEAVLSGDPARVAQAAERVNMCGPGPVMALLACMGALGEVAVREVGYATSGDTGGEADAVVGYLSALVTVR